MNLPINDIRRRGIVEDTVKKDEKENAYKPSTNELQTVYRAIPPSDPQHHANEKVNLVVPYTSGIEGTLTRSQIIKKKNEIVRTIRNLLDENVAVRGMANKINIVTKLMNYIVDHKGFVHQHPKFSETVRKKIIEHASNYNLFYKDHYQILFGEELPIFPSY